MLRETCPFSEFFLSIFSRIRNGYGEMLRISPYSVRMRANTGQKNSKYRHLICSEVCFWRHNTILFLFQNLVELVFRIFIRLSSNFWYEPAILMLRSHVLIEMKIHISACFIKNGDHTNFCHYYLTASEKNVILIYLLSTKTWLFSFKTKYVSQTNRFGIC